MATKIDNAWQKLFDKYNILEEIKQNQKFEITADQIKEFREPRLMTKFDSSNDLPKLFEENNLSILPISSNKYVISSNKIFKDIKITTDNCKQFEIPDYIESINIADIISEAIALNCAYICNILADFTGDKNLVPTVNGKMSSNKFNFKINNVNTGNKDEVSVNNSRIEIDGAFEGVDYLTLIEAKRKITDDFIIRQLYYPYRTLSQKVNKPIKCIYMVYSNGVFSLFEYKFEDIEDYNSIKLVKQSNYTIENFELNIETLNNLIKETKIVPEPKIPFPQADTFNRVINLCELLQTNSLDKENLTETYDFTNRQTDYYVNACKYLRLVEDVNENNSKTVQLSSIGKKIMSSSFSKRQSMFIKQILEHKVFREVLVKSLEKGSIIKNNEIVTIMKESSLYNINSDTTYTRRASTISGWIDWVFSLLS